MARTLESLRRSTSVSGMRSASEQNGFSSLIRTARSLLALRKPRCTASPPIDGATTCNPCPSLRRQAPGFGHSRHLGQRWRSGGCDDLRQLAALSGRSQGSQLTRAIPLQTHNYSPVRRYYQERNKIWVTRRYWSKFPFFCAKLFFFSAKDYFKILFAEDNMHVGEVARMLLWRCRRSPRENGQERPALSRSVAQH
jgi:hypothetical protein